jgi:Ca-activated chloride channel family protein
MIKKLSTYHQILLLTGITEALLWAVFLLIFNPWGLFLNDYSWLHPEYFWMFIVLPVLLGVSIWHWTYKSKLAALYSNKTKTSVLSIKFNLPRAFLHYLLLRSVFFFSVLALAQPVKGSRNMKGSKRMLDIIICLDVSNSMNTADMSGGTTRLEAAKNTIGELVNGLKGERLGIIVFANSAFTQLPLTNDIGAAKIFIPDISSNLVPDQGTNIGAAYEMALKQFKDEDAGRHILVITDGEDHEETWADNLSELKSKNIGFTFLGLGTASGGPVPVDPGYPELGYKKYHGATVTSHLNESEIKRMARKSGGNAVISSSAYPDIRDLVDMYKNSKSRTVKQTTFEVKINYYYIPLWITIACFILFLFLPQIVNRRL